MPTDTQGSYFLKVIDPHISPTTFLAQVFHKIASKVARGRSYFQTRYVDSGRHVGADGGRATAKILPIEGTCQANEQEIVLLAEKLVPPHFHAPNPPFKALHMMYRAIFTYLNQFRIDFRRRLNDKMNRDKVTGSVVKVINYPNVVDLKKPDKIVFLEVIKVCDICSTRGVG